MRRSLVELAGATGVALVLSGCGFTDGDAWGEVDLGLDVSFAVPAERLDGGRLKTNNDFRVALEPVALTIGAVELVGGASAAAAFDPADPPEGYSLCHNGHCHADDGRLVPYEDIAAELGATSGGAVVTATGAEVDVALGASAAVPLTCAAGCAVAEPTRVSTARVTASGWRLFGVVTDARTGDAARLPAEGRAFEVAGEGEVIWTGAARAAFGPGEELEATVDLELALPATLFDGIAWDTASDDTIAAGIAQALGAATIND